MEEKMEKKIQKNLENLQEEVEEIYKKACNRFCLELSRAKHEVELCKLINDTFDDIWWIDGKIAMLIDIERGFLKQEDYEQCKTSGDNFVGDENLKVLVYEDFLGFGYVEFIGDGIYGLYSLYGAEDNQVDERAENRGAIKNHMIAIYNEKTDRLDTKSGQGAALYSEPIKRVIKRAISLVSKAVGDLNKKK